MKALTLRKIIVKKKAPYHEMPKDVLAIGYFH